MLGKILYLLEISICDVSTLGSWKMVILETGVYVGQYLPPVSLSFFYNYK